VVIAGTGRNGKIFRSVDFGAHWDLVQALGSEKFVYSFLTLGNGSTLAGTGDNANIWKSLNCAADLDIIHNLGFMPSTAIEPTAYYLLAQPKFDPFPVHFKYQSSDYIHINLLQGGIYEFACAQVTEVLYLKAKAMPYHMLISQTEWLSNTAVGPLPGTIERVGSYTPLVTAAFDDILSENDNNVQAAMNTLDNHTHGPQLVGKTEKAAPDDADLFSLVDSLTLTHLVRKIAWADIKANIGGITEAPIDGTLYGRQAGSWQRAASSGREKLTAPRYYYVRTDGSDSNDGSANNSWSAFASLGHALAVCGSLDFNLQTVNIYLADGTYTSQVIIPNLFGGGTLCVIGNQGTPANVLLSVANNLPIYCIAAIIGVNLMFSYFKIQASGSAFALIQHIGIGAIHLSHMNFGTSPGHQLYAEGSGAMIVCTSDAYTISGGGSTHWYTELQATISVTATTVTLSGAPAFSVAFAKASHLSLENLGGNTYSGSATGKRYDAQHNSVIASGTTLPGNAAGTTATQGIYL